jgi:anaerobic selenocysteine-containing dehydrogenase
MYRGYTCVKGRNQVALYNHPDRLTRPLRRGSDGRFAAISLDQAVDEVAERLRTIRDRHGPRSVAIYCGTNVYIGDPINLSMIDAFLRGLGSPMFFNSGSIDQPGKLIAKGLHGVWMAPGYGVEDPDVAVLVGNNPLVSHQGRTGNPGDAIKDIVRKGGLVVVDPRRTETAAHASIHLQPIPGTDPAILAAMIRVILEEGRGDRAFLAENVTGIGHLRRAVSAFSPDSVAFSAGIAAGDLVRAARLFASHRRGYAAAGTGPNMTGQGTLIEYLILCLDTICGHWMRAGEQVCGALSITPAHAQPKKAQAMPPFPSYGFGESLRVRGLRNTAAGLQTAALPDEILLPGEGQVRALLSIGGNPAASWPDQIKTVEALRALDLLVHTDVQMSATAKLADYVIASKLPYEIAGTNLFNDFVSLFSNGLGQSRSYAQYTPPIVDPPDGADVVEDWNLLYRLAQGMNLQLELYPGLGSLLPGGAPTYPDMARIPTFDEMLDLVHSGSRIPLEEVKRHPHGAFFPDPPVYVGEKDSGWQGRLDVGNAQMMSDLAASARDSARVPAPDTTFPFRLISRRLRHVHNSPGVAIPEGRPRYNPAYVHPDELGRLDLEPGSLVRICSARSAVLAIVQSDSTVRPGVVSMAHAFGDLPDSDDDVVLVGSSTSRLLDSAGVFDRYSGQPLMSNVPVRIEQLTEPRDSTADTSS